MPVSEKNAALVGMIGAVILAFVATLIHSPTLHISLAPRFLP